MSAASPLHRLYEAVRRRQAIAATVVVAYALAGQFLLREWHLQQARVALGGVVLVLGVLVAAANLREILDEADVIDE